MVSVAVELGVVESYELLCIIDNQLVTRSAKGRAVADDEAPSRLHIEELTRDLLEV